MPPVVTDDLRACQIDAVSALERSMAANRARALNKLALNAGWDTEMLALEIGELGDLGFDLSLTGFGDEEIAGLLNTDKAGLTDPDDVPEVPETPVSRMGDIWLLGRHRLLCGDSTRKEDVDRVLAGVRPHLMVTDPPYGVNYDPTWRESAGLTDGSSIARGKVLNDDRAACREAWALFPGDVAYVWHGALHATIVAQSPTPAASPCARSSSGTRPGWSSAAATTTGSTSRRSTASGRARPGTGQVAGIRRRSGKSRIVAIQPDMAPRSPSSA
jgi:hypothetical protein